MHRLLILLVCLACRPVAARELVHPFPPTGPAEVTGSVSASKALRTMQRYSMPAFTDVLALHVAQVLQGEEEPFVVLRKPRHAGNEAAAYVASAAPDGRTLLLASAAPDPQSLRKRRALVAIGVIATIPYVLVARSEPDAGSVTALLKQGRAPGRRLLIATPGERTAGHFAIHMAAGREGLALEPVAYNGGMAALNALVTKQVGVALVPLATVLPYLGGGQLAALAIAQSDRHPRIAAVQTTAEAGVPELQAAAAFEVSAPGGTADAIVRTLQGSLARGMALDATRELLIGFGLQPPRPPRDVFSSP